MQQLTVVSLVFALFMMDALRTAGVLPCSVSMALVLCALDGALIAFIWPCMVIRRLSCAFPVGRERVFRT